MKILWSKEAVSDLAYLQAYVAENNFEATQHVASAILHGVETLSRHPAVGRPGRLAGTRELVIPRTPVIVPYRMRGKMLEILRVYHQSRRWPEHF